MHFDAFLFRFLFFTCFHLWPTDAQRIYIDSSGTYGAAIVVNNVNHLRLQFCCTIHRPSLAVVRVRRAGPTPRHPTLLKIWRFISVT